NRILTASGRPIHVDRDLESVPVHRGRFGKMVVDDDPNPITLVHLNRRAWSAAVVSPKVNDPARKDLLFHRFGNEMKFFYVSVHAPRKLRNVGGVHGNDPTATALGSVAHVLHVHGFFARPCGGCKEARGGSQTCAQTESLPKEITSFLHRSSSL